MIKSRVIFVGNIPYDKTETQLIDIFSEAGNVLSFRLVFDRDTGKPKGYGFCTYQDYETAASAVRNLNNYDIGGRQLRVDFAESDKEALIESDRNTNGQQRVSRQEQPMHPPPMMHHNPIQPMYQQPMQPMQPMIQQQPQSVEAIRHTVQKMDPQQTAEVLSYLKLMTQTNPEQVSTLLAQNPQLSFAIFEALISMKLVDQFAMQRILAAQNTVAPQFPVAHMAPAQTMAPFPMMVPPPNTAGPDIAIQLQEQQRQMVLQLINLTPEQIQALPRDQQQQVIQLRAQIMGNQ